MKRRNLGAVTPTLDEIVARAVERGIVEQISRTQDDLVAFMERVATAYPGKQVHVVWESLNTHRAQAVWQAFNARLAERFHFHFTPLHASWRHLVIKRLDDEEPTVVARLTELGRNRYGAAFRSQNGRWEPLPGAGTLDEMAQVIVTLLQPYLQPDNY